MIVGVGLDKNLDEVKAAINRIYPAKMSLVLIRSQASRAPTRLVITFTKSEKTKTLLISHGLMLGLTHHQCEESGQDQSSSPPLPRRDAVIQCYQCQGFGHKANACTQEARCIRCEGHHKLTAQSPEIPPSAPTASKTTLPATWAASNTRTSYQRNEPSQ